MEPAGERREHRMPMQDQVVWANVPQWSPPVNGGSTTGSRVYGACIGAPQWSPPVNGGSTRAGGIRPVQAVAGRNGARR